MLEDDMLPQIFQTHAFQLVENPVLQCNIVFALKRILLIDVGNVG